MSAIELNTADVPAPVHLKTTEGYVVRYKDGRERIAILDPAQDNTVLYFGSDNDFVVTYSSYRWFRENHTLIRIIPANKLVLKEVA